MQDLEQFKNEMNLSGKNVYVGHRYVPKIMGEWSNNKTYEPLSVVTYQGASYTSRQYVPTGVEITNEDFWVLSGNYNAQVENYRQEVINVNKEVKTGLKQVNDEVVNARNGEKTLSDRLLKEQQQFNEQLAQTGTTKKTLSTPKRGAVSFIIDDGYVADYNYVLPAIQNENVPLNIALITERIGTNDFMTIEQILDLQNNHGWEVLSHTVTHARLGDLTEAQQEAELRNSKETLTNLGLKVNSIAYPFGSHTDTTKELARKYYRSARSTDFGLNGLNNSPIDTYALKTIWLDGTAVMPANDPSGYQANQIEYYQYYIDLAAKTGQWLNVLMHGNQMEFYDHAPLLKRVIQYAKGKIDILTVNDALNRYGNILDTGIKKEEEPYKKHFTVGFDGKLSTNHLPTVWVENNKFDGSHSILDFPTHQVTFNKVFTQNAKDTNLPEGVGGLLYTYKVERERTANPFFNYQEYTSLYSGNTYKRVVLNDNSWGEWKQISSTLHTPLETNKYTTKTVITDYPDGLTISRISTTTAQNTGSPQQLGGELITYKYAQSLGYSFQEYYIYGSTQYYKRSVNDDGTYKPWCKMKVTKTVATPRKELPAGVITNLEISPSELTENSIVNVKPQGIIPTSVLFSYNIREGKIMLKFYNTSTNDSAIEPMDWLVHMVDAD